MKTPVNYFAIASGIWNDWFETRAGRKFGPDAMSRRKREELLAELRATIKPKESTLNDKELIKKIEESRAKKLENDVNNAFKK